MSLQDPIADMLTRIRNALGARQEVLSVPASGVCEGVLRVLKEEGYIQDYKRIEDAKQGLLRVYLKYGPMGEDVVSEIQRVSTPGKRVYKGAKDLPRPMNGMGISIVSTSKGVLSDRQCRQQNIGGEVLAVVS
jgi:small subunit ribosomal protein S8